MQNHITQFLKTTINEVTIIDDDQLNEIISRFQCRIFLKNDFLLKEGQICNFWGFIYEGLIRSYTFRDTGEEYTNGCMREGSFISESMSFVHQVPSKVNCQALEDTMMIYLTYPKLQQVYADFPVFEKFARMLYEERMAQVKSNMLYRIQLDATSRYLHFVKAQPDLLKRVPLKYIASYLNITDSTLSRIRRKTLHMPV